jgi:hypothetical protein
VAKPTAPRVSGRQQTEGGDKTGSVTGYSVVLPPGWRRIPIQHGTPAAVRDIAEEVLRRRPPHITADQVAPQRAQLERRLSELAKQARAGGGVDLYLPVVPIHGTPVPASFIVSQGTPLAADVVDPGQVAGYLAASGDASAAMVDGSPGARIESIASAETAPGIHTGSHRVDYVLPVPGHPGRWLIAAFATPGDGDPSGEFAGLLVRLFDSIMLTFRWTTDQAAG